MHRPPRKLAFVLASTNHGSMIVNRMDYRMVSDTSGYGVGYQLLEAGAFDQPEVSLALQLLQLRRKHAGDGVVALDCGANIGVHTIEWAMAMTGWGSVLAIEAQERVYYALAGNIALNNCFNAIALNAAISSEAGSMRVPQPDYQSPASFGSLELRKSETNEFIGQVIRYEDDATVEVRTLAVDDFNLPRVDFIKIDVEGMEMDVLAGAGRTISASQPVMLIEQIKSNASELTGWLEKTGYVVMPAGINLLAVHATDPVLSEIRRD